MPDPIAFLSVSPRHALPLLFAGQAQKEFTVNEALARIDALLHPAVSGTASAPPISPVEGDCWLVGLSPGGAWADQEGKLTWFAGATWLFADPCEGMRVLDRTTGQIVFYRGGEWSAATLPTPPSGGATVDAEARTAIAGLVSALRDAGILPAV